MVGSPLVSTRLPESIVVNLVIVLGPVYLLWNWPGTVLYDNYKIWVLILVYYWYSKQILFSFFRESLAVDPRSEPLVGERVPYVIVYGPPGLPLIRLVKKWSHRYSMWAFYDSCLHRPMDLLVNPTLWMNGEYYVTKQILPALYGVFSLVNVDVTKW